MRLAIMSLAGLLLATPVYANDSTAELATTGLVLTKSDDIAMKSEELYISLEEIRVSYRFFNKSSQDIKTLVAFPMPDVTMETAGNIAIPTEDPQNLLGFRTVADGKPVQARVEQTALAKGVDHTAMLQRLGIPIAVHLRSTNEAMDRLPRAQWDELVQLGLAEITHYGSGTIMEDHLEARWTLKTTYFWEQVFPAQRELAVEHRYKPSVGGSVQTSLAAPGSRKEEWFADYQRKYCMDADFLRSMERSRRRTKSDHGARYAEQRIAYVLSTGANWAGPIGDFRLIVDKGNAKNVVSFCGQGVKKIGPTRFEMRKSDFTPQGDLYFLFLQPL